MARECITRSRENEAERESSRAIRVMIVDDHVAMRIGLKSMLELDGGLQVVATAASGREAISLLDEAAPDILLLDLRMPEMDGITFMQAIHQRYSLRVIVLTSYELEEDIYRAVKAGAQGYLLKDASEEELHSAIVSVHAGQSYFPRHIASRLADRMHRSNLSSREIDVLEMMAKGLTNKQIANALGISSHTVRCHVANITLKLEVSDRTEAVAIAIKQGVIKLA